MVLWLFVTLDEYLGLVVKKEDVIWMRFSEACSFSQTVVSTLCIQGQGHMMTVTRQCIWSLSGDLCFMLFHLMICVIVIFMWMAINFRIAAVDQVTKSQMCVCSVAACVLQL